MKMGRSRKLILLIAGLTSLVPAYYGARPAQAAERPTYVIAFVPLAWSGSRAEFEAVARRHGELFVSESGIANYAEVELLFLEDGPPNISLNDPWLVQEVVAAGLLQSPADRYVGLTDQDLAPFGDWSVAGWTLGPDSLGSVMEAVEDAGTAHELGHTFSLCDEYLYSEWSQEDGEWGCPNPFPPHCSQENGVWCEGLPAPDGRHSIMGPAGLPCARSAWRSCPATGSRHATHSPALTTAPEGSLVVASQRR